jgi:hypothetical protein
VVVGAALAAAATVRGREIQLSLFLFFLAPSFAYLLSIVGIGKKN